MKYILLLFLSISLAGYAQQEKLNQFDENGKRHGAWQKKFEGTDKIRYSGQFKHGKEVGEFKFYHKKGGKHPSTIKTFNPDNHIAIVKHYTSEGKLVSEGKMDGRKLIGEWIYYHKNSKIVLTKERYKNGLLEGKRVTYYPNEVLAEEEHYKKGLLDGERKVFSEDGKLIKHFNYKEGKMHGQTTYYDTEGKVSISGRYKMNKRVGKWNYYKNGKLQEVKDYTHSDNPYKKKD